jgi:LPXTG-motif cell wall-anchored protein
MSRPIGKSLKVAVPALAAALLGTLVMTSSAGAAQAPVGLGTATSFGVLAGSGITNTGATTITGDIGTFPTPTITGLGTIVLVPPSVNHADDAVTQGAKDDLQTAFDDAGSRLPIVAADADFAGDTLTPGVYSGATLGLTGVLTLDFEGDPTSQFVFKAASTLITGPGASVVMINTAGGDACRVVWQVGSSATFDTTTSFVGDVLAHTSISANAGATFQGRLLALNGAVTLIDNTIDRGSCATIDATPPTTTGGGGGGGGGGGHGTTTSTTSTTSTTIATTTTTTRAPTTTTAAPTTTVTATPVAEATPDVVIAGGPATPTDVGLQTQQPPIGGSTGVPELPRTGSDVTTLAAMGAAMVLIGSTIVRAQRRIRIRATR